MAQFHGTRNENVRRYGEGRQDDHASQTRMSEDVWEGLYRAYCPQVRSYFAARGLCPQDADDLTQQVFMELGERRVPQDPGTYLLAMARNIMCRYLRQQTKESEALTELIGSMAKNARIIDFEEFTTRWGKGRWSPECRNVLVEVLAQLSPKNRRVMEMRYLEGLTVKEMASRMGCSDHAVRKRLQRIRTVLRQSRQAKVTAHQHPEKSAKKQHKAFDQAKRGGQTRKV